MNDTRRALVLFPADKPRPPLCFYFGTLPDGREFQTRGATIWAIAVGKERTPEGTRTIWKDLPEEERFDIDLTAITGHPNPPTTTP